MPVIVTPTPSYEINVTLLNAPVVIDGDGMQGPQGEAGAPGAGGDSVAVSRIAQNAIGGHRIVRAVLGEVDLADSTDAAHGDDVLGLTTHAVTQGAPVQVLTNGSITEPSWSWTPGEPLFLAANGLMSHTPPVDPAFDLIVGFAETPTTVFINLGTPIYY